MTGWNNYIEGYVECPYCEDGHGEERITGFGLCVECCRFFAMQELTLFRTREITEDERETIRPNYQFFRDHGFEVRDD